jgi:hypothetical protein
MIHACVARQLMPHAAKPPRFDTAINILTAATHYDMIGGALTPSIRSRLCPTIWYPEKI